MRVLLSSEGLSLGILWRLLLWMIARTLALRNESSLAIADPHMVKRSQIWKLKIGQKKIY